MSREILLEIVSYSTYIFYTDNTYSTVGPGPGMCSAWRIEGEQLQFSHAGSQYWSRFGSQHHDRFLEALLLAVVERELL